MLEDPYRALHDRLEAMYRDTRVDMILWAATTLLTIIASGCLAYLAATWPKPL